MLLAAKLPTLTTDGVFARDALASLLIVLAALVLRSLVLRAIRRSRLDVEDQLRWRAQVRNATITVILVGVTVVWAQELRAVAISFAAIMAAVLIAGKEFLMCLLGSALRASGSSFKVGDRIEVSGIRGDVLDIGPLTTTVLEVGPGQSIHQRTGRRVTVPNSTFLLHPVTNETTSHEFVLHVLRVPVTVAEEWQATRDRLLQIAHARCSSYVEPARRALAQAAPAGVGSNLVSTEPMVYIEVPEPGRVELLLRFPAPARRRGRVAQQILRTLLGDTDVDEDDPEQFPASGSHA